MPVNKIINHGYQFVSDIDYNRNKIENVWFSLKVGYI